MLVLQDAGAPDSDAGQEASETGQFWVGFSSLTDRSQIYTPLAPGTDFSGSPSCNVKRGILFLRILVGGREARAAISISDSQATLRDDAVDVRNNCRANCRWRDP
jgi:hypothetical protein